MKRLTAIVLCVLLLAQLLPAAWAAETPEEERIATVEEFLHFADACVLESYSVGRVFSLTADIDLSDSGFEAIPYFAGTLKGNGHAILGLRLTGEGSRQGLFRSLGPDALVQNLMVRGTVAPGGSRCYVGGLVGENQGTLQGCSFEGSVSGLDNVGGLVGENAASGQIRDCSFRGSVKGEHQVGGVAGLNRGSLQGCTNGGAVNAESVVPSGESRFDLASLTVEDFLDLTNIGGIVGQNDGLVYRCRNNGAVGYPNTGYNVGGVAGKSGGYLKECSNHAAIQGRRDVGGLVGQLIPYTAWDFSEGKLDALGAEIQGMHALLNQTAADAQGLSVDVIQALNQMTDFTGQAVGELENVLQRYQENSLGLLDSVQLDPETGQLIYAGQPDWLDTGRLSEALYNMYGQSAALAESAGGSVGSLAEDIAAISNQMDRIFNSLYTTAGALRSVTGKTYDLSLSETYQHDVGAVDACENYGDVAADNHAGGVAGGVAFELAFDMEDQLNTSERLLSNAKEYVFAAIRDCGSFGEIRAKQDYAGGIVGEMDVGVVVKGVAMGTVASDNGSYVGGVAGRSQGTVSDCWARTVLSGNRYVGGIAGQTEAVTGCRAWTQIREGREYLGAVAGWVDGQAKDNLYVSGRPAGVDDVARVGQATPVEAQELLDMEDVPGDFDSLTLRFVVEGRTIQTLTLPFGGSVSELPHVENKDEKYWKWDEFDREHIYHSMRIEGKYYAPNTTIDSGEEPPKFLVEGLFYQGQRLLVADYAPELPVEELLDAYTLHVEGYEGALTVRMNQSEAGTLYAAAPGGQLEKTDCERDGSYVVFQLHNGGSFAYVRPQTRSDGILYAGLGGGLLAGIALIWVLRRGKSKESE